MADQKPRDQRSDLQTPAAPQQQPGYPQNFQPIIFDGFEGLNTKPTRPAIEDQQCFWLDNWMPLGKSNLRTLYDIGAPIFLAPIVATTWNPSDKTNIDLSNANLTADAVAGIAVPTPAYTTGAVHFAGAGSSVVNAALTATDGASMSMSFWFNQAATQDRSIWAVDVAGVYGTSTQLQFPEGNILNIYIGNGDFSKSIIVKNNAHTLSNATWHHILFSTDTDHPSGSKLAKLYVDGVDETDTFTDVNGAFFAAFNALSFSIGDDTFGNGPVMDMADFWLAPNQSLLTAGDIAPATLAKFFSGGKPVDLGADGSTPTGTAPVVFFRRAPSAAASTFATNLGTGGAFAIVGALTDATTSPSD